MAKKGLDLTGLDDLSVLANAHGGSGANAASKIAPLAEIIADPNQPRKRFNQRKLEELRDSIKESGVQQAIIVRPKNDDGKHIIVFGERRYRASLLAGKKDIPIEIRDTTVLPESEVRFIQLIENIQRDDLDPLEIADAIKEQLDQGMKKAQIAAKLGQSASFVSQHVALAEGPEFIRELAMKRVGVRTLYDLVQAHKDFSSEVEIYAASTEEITRAGVADLVRKLKAVKQEPTNNAEQQNVGEAITLANNASGISNEQTPEGGVCQGGEGKADGKLTAPTQPTTFQQQTGGQMNGAPVVANAKKLAIVVKVGGRVATMGRGGKVEVIFKDTGDVAVIELASLEIVGTEVIKHENV
ncbi:ParB/RepB/Spo0J family partition protein [Xanthomonas albilineans]|uniref:ParB/RepB/Spo0J family partition protein n=1 Tax=Xanthomonas albilineans TaxID=29447 RepID=UPI000696D861|nr:ParB/RepB/Spo0J family partition protein [Xanthomonas albilineans]